MIAATTPANPSRHVSALADDLMNDVEGVLAGLITPQLVTTGYPDLDRAMNGYEPGTLVIAAGRPGMGKTVLANASGRRCASSGVGVLEFPLEIGPAQMVARHLADMAYRGAGRSAAFRDIGKRAKGYARGSVCKRSGRPMHDCVSCLSSSTGGPASPSRRLQQRSRR